MIATATWTESYWVLRRPNSSNQATAAWAYYCASKFGRAPLVYDKVGYGVRTPARFPLVGLVEIFPVIQTGQLVSLGVLDFHVSPTGRGRQTRMAFSKTLVGRILLISRPIAEALARRRARRNPTSPLVFHRDGIPVRRWRTAWRTACQAAGVPTRFLHDCQRTAARNLTRATPGGLNLYSTDCGHFHGGHPCFESRTQDTTPTAKKGWFAARLTRVRCARRRLVPS